MTKHTEKGLLGRGHFKKRILVQVRGGAEFITAGRLKYFEDFKRGTSKEIGPKGIFEIASNIYVTIIAGLLLIFVSSAWGGEEIKKKEIRVFTERQVLVALENGEEIYSFDIVTGRGEKETTAGRYKIFRKHEKYTSKTYGSEMPYTMFFTKDGKAIHGTTMATLRSYLHSYLTESVGSEGCVGLTDDNAKALFGWAPVGTHVIVISEEK